MSRNGGRTWLSVSLKGETDFHALTWSPRDGGQLYGWSVAGQPALYRVSAATGSAQRLPGRGLSGVLALSAGPDPAGPLLAGTRTGLLVSRDAGVSWEPDAAVPAGAVVTAVAHRATDAKLVYAYFARSGGGRLGRSGDGGNTWELIGLPMDPSAAVIALAVGPGDHVALATTSPVTNCRNVMLRGELMTMAPERSLLRSLVGGLIGSLVWGWTLFGPAAAQGVPDDVRSLLGQVGIQVPSQATSPPSFSLQDVNGTPVRLADLKGRALMLYFWTTW
jgi:hypothetical protein